MAWLIVVSVSLAVYVRLQIQLPLEPPNLNRNDLKHLYLGSRILLRGENPYPFEALQKEAEVVRHPHMQYLNPYVYPPFTGYFFGWLGKLDYESAARVWFWGGHLLLLGSLALLWGGMKVFHPMQRAGIMAVSVSLLFPLYRSTQAGQLNAVLLFFLSAVFWLWRNGYKKWAGSALGLAALIKVQPAFLVLWLLRKKEWRALAAAAVAVPVLVLIPATRYGLGPYRDYFEVMGQMRYGSSTWSDQGAAYYVEEGNIGVPALFYRTLSDNPKTEPWVEAGAAAYWLSVIWGLAALLLCWFCCRTGRRDEDPEMEMGAWIWGMLLIPSLFWDHYLVLALPAWFILISRLAESGTSEGTLWITALCWGWISLWFQWFRPENLSGIGLLYLNATLPPVLILFFLSLRMAKTSHRSGGYTLT
jgi:hypothetical protein